MHAWHPMRGALLWSSQNRWLAGHLPQRRFVRRAVRRFMPGEHLEDALREAERLKPDGLSTLVTLLGENLDSVSATDEVVEEYRSAMARAVERALDLQVSVKLTQLGVDIDPERTLTHLSKISETSGRRVWIDMEGSSHTDVTLDLYRQAHERGAHVGVCLQAYLLRTPDDLDRLLPLSPAVRLVKGAYAEPQEIAHARKRDVDDEYRRLGLALLDHVDAGRVSFVAFGTHDRRLVDTLDEAARTRGLDRDRYEFGMLYGIERDLQKRLADRGTPLRVLISYGTAWFPWYMRRLAERPANLGFVLRSLWR